MYLWKQEVTETSLDVESQCILNTTAWISSLQEESKGIGSKNIEQQKKSLTLKKKKGKKTPHHTSLHPLQGKKKAQKNNQKIITPW